MKVVGIVGSPKREGNTAKLVEAVMEGAKEAGHETMLVYLCELNIGPLEAKKEKITYPKDDMVQLYPHLETMGALVLGTPIYYDQVSARTKLFIDRLHYYSKTHGEEYRQRFPYNVKSVNIITHEWDKLDAYDEVLEWMKGRLEHYWKMQVVASLIAEGTHGRPVAEREALLQQAKELAPNLFCPLCYEIIYFQDHFLDPFNILVIEA